MVSSSNLNSAPQPLPDGPRPKKKNTCLVQGIRANRIAARLPEGAKVPPSFPAVITDANKALRTLGLEGAITDILYGVRRHLTLIFDQVIDDTTRTAALNFVLGKFNATPAAAQELKRATHLILKFTAVPTVSHDGCHQISEDIATALLRKHPAWKDIELLDKPRFIFPKRNPDPLVATLQVKVHDTRKATVAKKLLETTVTFVGVARRCQPWSIASTARQCSTCLKWGHSATICRSRKPRCGQCAGTRLSSYHDSHARQCKSSDCTHYHIVCVNCNDQHNATSTLCPFFKARLSPGQLQQLQEQRLARLRRNL